jgi:hypothetical protein
MGLIASQALVLFLHGLGNSIDKPLSREVPAAFSAEVVSDTAGAPESNVCQIGVYYTCKTTQANNLLKNGFQTNKQVPGK